MKVSIKTIEPEVGNFKLIITTYSPEHLESHNAVLEQVKQIHPDKERRVELGAVSVHEWIKIEIKDAKKKKAYFND